MIGRYRYIGVQQACIVFTMRDDKLPCLLRRVFPRRNGFACGQVVLVKHGVDTFLGRVAVVHGIAHVEQAAVLGVLYPIVYFATWATMKLVCRHMDAVYDHPLEVDARCRQMALGVK